MAHVLASVNRLVAVEGRNAAMTIADRIEQAIREIEFEEGS